MLWAQVHSNAFHDPIGIVTDPDVGLTLLFQFVEGLWNPVRAIQRGNPDHKALREGYVPSPQVVAALNSELRKQSV